MTDTLEVRIAHLEGAYEQVDKRLGSIDSTLVQLRSDLNSSSSELRGEMGQLRADLHSSSDQLRADLNSSTQQIRVEVNQFRSELTGRMDGQFHWLLGTIFTSWVTLLLAIFFRS